MADTKPPKILVVDDESDVTELVAYHLKAKGFQVEVVNNPNSSIGTARSFLPDLVILDVMMPDLNGWQLLHQLKASPATASIPVVMLTVFAESTTGYVLGADDYLIKPIRSDVLLNTLRHVIASRESSSKASKRETQPV